MWGPSDSLAVFSKEIDILIRRGILAYMLRGWQVMPLLLSLLVWLLLIFSGGDARAAVDHPVYQSTFTCERLLRGPLTVRFANDGLRPISLVLKFPGEDKLAVTAAVEGSAISAILGPDVQTAQFDVIFLSPRRLSSIPEARVYSAGALLPGHWSFPEPMPQGNLANVTDTLSFYTVGVADTHTVAFNTTTTPVSDSGIIWVIFPQGFDIGGISGAIYSDDDPTNDGNEPVVASVNIADMAVQFYLDSTSQQAQPGSRIRIKFWPVVNDTLAGDKVVVVQTTGPDGGIDNGPSASEPFTLQPGPLDHISILPDSALTIPADSSVRFDVSGRDAYDNIIAGITFAYGVTVDSCGQVDDAVFRALKLGTCYMTASSGGIVDSSGLITVVPGPLAGFGLSGYPSSTVAGQPFVLPVNVTALDVQDNVKYDYLGLVWFASNDTIADLPYYAGNPYQFTASDSGSVDFAGSGFVLKTAGVKNITATNGVIGITSDPISVAAGPIVAFVMGVGSPQIAGQSFNLQVTGAVDSFGNSGSGVVVVADSVGGGNSPDSIPPSYNNVVVFEGVGSASQTVTNAVPTVLKGTVGAAVAATDTFEVLPGNFGRFDLYGYPDSVLAGVNFSGLTVSAYDLFGNLKTNYAGSVYFTSSDTAAALPYDEFSRYDFSVQDSGTHAFNEPFSLRTAGGQTVAVTDGVTADSSNTISVRANVIDGFALVAPDTVIAGMSFPLDAVNCRDAWGNPADGLIVITDSLGGGNSPDGTPPTFTSIQVSGGFGSAVQTLVNVNPTVLAGSTEVVVAITDTIIVVPGPVGEFQVDISSPQYSGVAFVSPATVTAYDLYGNLKSDYDASVDSVVVASVDGGVMSNNVLDLPGDFVMGQADLSAKGTTYFGRGGPMTFSATSQSGATGASGVVDMNAISCDSVMIDQSVLSWGDTATGVVVVTNGGSVGASVTALVVFTQTGWSLQPSQVVPPLPDSVGPGGNQRYDISLPIPSGFELGAHPLTAAVTGLFNPYVVADTAAGFPDTLIIQAASRIGYIPGSLSRDTLSRGEYYTLSLRLSNSGDAGLVLVDSSYLRFSDGSAEFRASVSTGVYLPPNTPFGVNVVLDSALVDTSFVDGTYPLEFHYFGTENGHFLSGTLFPADSVTVQTGADIVYIDGSLNYDTLVAGQDVSFVVDLTNTGTATFLIEHQNTKIQFSDSLRQFAALSDTSSDVRVDMIASGDTVSLHFTRTTLPVDFTIGSYLPQVVLSGEQNGREVTTAMDTYPDSVRVLSPSSIRIDSTYAISLNAPFVNISQPCSVRVVVANLGDEGVDSFYVHLGSDGLSSFPESLLVPHLAGQAYGSVIFPGTASDSPDSAEILVATISGGSGSITGSPPLIQQPVDNAALLIVEMPAELSLAPLSVAAPPEAEDDTVTVGQPVTISTVVVNMGQASVTGPRKLTLDLGNSGFSVQDSLIRDFVLGDSVYWSVTAPDTAVASAVLTTRFLGSPLDANDGSPAVGADSISTIEFVVDTRPAVRQNAAIVSPPGATDNIISTDQTFLVADTIFAAGMYSGLTVRLDLPPGFTTGDSLIRHPVDSLVLWSVRAPSEEVGGDTLTVLTWLYDVNTGDSVGTAPELIPVTVVPMADLRITTRISGPPSATDNIIEPGSSFEFEARVINAGQARTGPGQLLFLSGHPDMLPQEGALRDFEVDVPVSWVVSAPDSEISTPVPVSAIIYSIPQEENTGAPAVVSVDSSAVAVSVKELLPRMVFTEIEAHSGSVVRGQELSFVTFTLSNSDRGGGFPIGVSGLAFGLQTNPHADAGELISRAAMVSDFGVFLASDISGDSVMFAFADTILIQPESSVTFQLELTIGQNAPVKDFTLSLESDGVGAVSIENGEPSAHLEMVSPDGSPIWWRSEPTAVLEPSFKASISNYPNPFDPRKEATKIGYYLATDSDLEVKIFTLVGELVWSRTISASQMLGKAGLHTGQSALIWTGRNDAGKEIRSGVYICLVRNVTTGEEEKFKIAVVK